MDPSVAIQRLHNGFSEARNRIQHLEDTLTSERRAFQEALSDANANGAIVSLTLGAEARTLRQRIADLQAETKRLESEKLHADSQGTSWQQRLSTALEDFTKFEVVRAKCAEAEKTVASLREENRQLARKLAGMTEESIAATQLKVEAEESEARLQEKYDTQKQSYRELKRGYSELSAAQEEMAANVAAYEQMALDAGREKSEAEAALRDLRRRYDELKAKKRSKNPQENSKESAAQIELLTDEVSTLTQNLADSKKASGEELSKLRSMYREQKKLSGELQRQYDKLSATNQEVTKKCIALEKASKATAESGLGQEYAELKISHENLKTAFSDLEARNGQLQQECHDLWTSKKEMAKARRSPTCTEVCDAAERMEREGMQSRSTITALENRVGNLTEANEALQSRMNERIQTSMACAQYSAFMDRFPYAVHARPAFHSLQLVGRVEMNLRDYLAADPACQASADRALYIPKRTIWASAACVHALAFAPTHRYDANTAHWTPGSDISSLDDAWRDLFLDVGQSVYYVGIYRCHDLRHLCPGGCEAPENVSALAMLDAAHLGSTTPPAERTRILRSFFPQGMLTAHCVGLECIGFNQALYDALRDRVQSDSGSTDYEEDSSVGGKRKRSMDESVAEAGSPAKRGGSHV
ncbi:hypothetical protein B0H11DRAFT_2291106 [Mycena galericulata]|nr:hypothetical protein B0H11DRAFT_2291106 [Mycena galericulata]